VLLDYANPAKHSLFVYSYEKVLREECLYNGYQPYGNWFSHQNDLRKTPIFDGSETSMSGNGLYVSHNGSIGGGDAIFLPLEKEVAVSKSAHLKAWLQT
jgi:tyrosinase